MFKNLQKDKKNTDSILFTVFFQNSLHNYERSCNTILNNQKKDICNKSACDYESNKSSIFYSIYYDRYVYYRDWLHNSPMNNHKRKKDSNYIW